WLERDHAMLLDFDRDVSGLASQPFTLTWRDPAGEKGSHNPGYFAPLAGGLAGGGGGPAGGPGGAGGAGGGAGEGRTVRGGGGRGRGGLVFPARPRARSGACRQRAVAVGLPAPAAWLPAGGRAAPRGVRGRAGTAGRRGDGRGPDRRPAGAVSLDVARRPAGRRERPGARRDARQHVGSGMSGLTPRGALRIGDRVRVGGGGHQVGGIEGTTVRLAPEDGLPWLAAAGHLMAAADFEIM